jgi:tetratricopeptide (TPR) repeat protein
MKSFCLAFTLLFLVTPVPAQKPVQDQFNRAIEELKAGHTDKAFAAITEVIKKNSKHADAYLFRGYLRMSAGDNSGALTDINKAIQLDHKLGQAYYQRSLLRIAGKDVKGAIQDLDSAIQNNYGSDSAYSLRAQLRRDQGDSKGAVSDLDEAIKLNPQNPQYWAVRSSVLLAMNDTDRALSDLNHVLSWYETDPLKRLEPVNTTATAQPDNRVKVAIDTGTVNPAPGDKEMIPFISRAYANRGFIDSARRDIDAAIADFTKSIRVDPTLVWAFYGRAQVLVMRKDWEAALADVSRAIQLEPMNGNLRIEHGVILTMMGKTAEAQVDFDMLLKADRTFWQKRIDERLTQVKAP